MIFAREINDPLASLVKKVNEANQKNAGMASFVVFCNDDESLKDKLKEMASKEKIGKTILTIENPSGPSGYKIAKDADVTAVLYVNKKVKANHAFKKGELNEKNVEAILADLPKILEK